ncbi:MAG: alanine racemase [Maricaulaceae bacterium]
MTVECALRTPCLWLDRARLEANIARFGRRVQALCVEHRLHVKTTKSLDVLAQVQPVGVQRIAVSTFKEAEWAIEAEVEDVLYALPIPPQKAPSAVALAQKAQCFGVFVGAVETAAALAQAARDAATPIDAWIEIDADGYRCGVRPDDPALIRITETLVAAPGVRLAGLYIYAGRTYNAESAGEGAAMVEHARAAALAARERVAAFTDYPLTLTLGGSPVAVFADTLDGVDELCAGVYVFQDLFQTGLGVCAQSDLALSVLATVIAVSPETGRAFIDAGALALSQDRSANTRGHEPGYGLVQKLGAPGCDFVVSAVSQEHGHVRGREGVDAAAALTVGDRVRVWPNHVCMTADGFAGYHVFDPAGAGDAFWPRLSG